jgi:hypothetical protein
LALLLRCQAEKNTQLVLVSGRPAPPPPAPVYWMVAWKHNLAANPRFMASDVMLSLNGTKKGLLMVDYEPQRVENT